jgi:hypothetical protein
LGASGGSWVSKQMDENFEKLSSKSEFVLPKCSGVKMTTEG